VAAVEKRLAQYRFKMVWTYPTKTLEAPIRSGIISQTGNEKKRKTKLDIGVNEERFDVLDYH
jgi:hypothetical protein